MAQGEKVLDTKPEDFCLNLSAGRRELAPARCFDFHFILQLRWCAHTTHNAYSMNKFKFVSILHEIHHKDTKLYSKVI